MSSIDDALTKHLFKLCVYIGFEIPEDMLADVVRLLDSPIPKREENTLSDLEYWWAAFKLVGIYKTWNNCTKEKAMETLAQLIHKSPDTVKKSAGKKEVKEAYETGIDIALVAIDKNHLKLIKDDTRKKLLTVNYKLWQEKFLEKECETIIPILIK